MHWLVPSLVSSPALALLALGLLPDRLVNSYPRLFGRGAMLLSGLSLFASFAAAFQVMTVGAMDAAMLRWTSPIPFCVGIHIDSIAVVMMSLISFIGAVIAGYSLRYLRGDSGQGRFFRWMSVTLGSTLVMVMSCNLVMFTIAWMSTSFGLHQLLTYYPERTWALWAARKKFLISRLGDAMLIVAVILTYCAFGTTEYTEVFAAANAIHAGTAPGSVATAWIGILFVLGAMTKSAQFPFHTWLPDTMETPTPVSALMHAGVINAGGFLVIRLSPLVSLSPIALDLLALIGAMTALMASTVMLTQTSIKRSLAYSTIAQMGFMMLQCGLGAFSAALLHIVAHSAYKAHAFLSCGSVLDSAARMKAPASPTPRWGRSTVALGISILIAALIAFGMFTLVGIDVTTKPGGLVLGLVLTLALTQLLWNALATGSTPLALGSLARAVAVSTAYLVAYLVTDHLVADSISYHPVAPSPLDAFVLGFVAIGFVGVFALEALTVPLAHRRWAKTLYVHAMNGFYIDIPARRLTALFYGQSAPVQ